MSKRNLSFICQNCGAAAPRWQGKCEACGEWNTLAEEGAERPAGPGRKPGKGRLFALEPLTGEAHEAPRLPSRHCRIRPRHRRRLRARLGAADGRRSRHRQIDAADPGRRRHGARRPPRGLYLRRGSGRPGAPARRAAGPCAKPVELAAETSVEDIIATLSEGKTPRLIVIDSIQTMWTELVESAPGTVTQVRGSAQALIRYAKRSGAAIILVGHVTKDGQIAGPRVVEHMVDAVLSFEGEGSHQFRILRAVKNRFGPTDEIGVFEMTGAGLREVANPSELFLSERDLGQPGTAVFAGIEGTRPLLVEIQALVAPTSLGTPQAGRGRLGPEPAVDGARRAGSPLRRQARRPRRLPQRRRRPAHPGAGGRSCRRRGAGLLARQCAAAGGCGLFRRGIAVRRDPAGGAGAGPAQRSRQARLYPRRGAGGRARRKRPSPASRSPMWQASPVWSPTSPPAARRASAGKPVDKTGDGSVTPRYTRGASKLPPRPFSQAGARAEMGIKLST